MRLKGIAIALGLCACAIPPAGAEEHPVFERKSDQPGATVIQYNKHDVSFAWDALEQLSGRRPGAGATRAQLAAATLAVLDSLPKYGQKSVARVEPPIPDWFLKGYRTFSPATVAKSRYLNAVLSGSLEANADTGALFAFWCAYDAEWFNAARNPAYKAWLSAVALSFPPRWLALREGGEGEAALKARLQTPLQTKDEPYREIGNWINAFTKLNDDRENPSGEGGAFIKPKVRSALVGELVQRGGLAYDARLTENPAYSEAAPQVPGLSDKQGFLLAALCTEFYQEIYEQAPGTKQPLWLRDYFLSCFAGQA